MAGNATRRHVHANAVIKKKEFNHCHTFQRGVKIADNYMESRVRIHGGNDRGQPVPFN